MHIELPPAYSARANEFRSKQKTHTKQLAYLSFLRLVLFALFVWFLVSTIRSEFTGYDLLYALLCITAFVVCVFWAAALQKKNKFIQQLVLINDNEVNVHKGLPSFLDNGAALAPRKGFTVDLNVFGSHSLFHLLNRTGSISGKKQFGEILNAPFTDPVAINNYQACTQELSGTIHFRQTLLAHALLLEEEEALAQLQSGIPETFFSVIKNKLWTLLAIVWPVAGTVITVYSIWADNYLLMLAFIVTGLLILTGILKKTNLLYYHISKRSYLYNQYARCFQLIHVQKFMHPYLRYKQDEIIHAAEAFTSLSRLTGLFDLRLSVLSFVINGLFLSDLLCARAYMNWNQRHQASIKTWFAALGEMELLNSLATFHYNHPYFIFPACTDKPLYIKAEAMGHPLMDGGQAIVNDFTIGEPAKLHLITGSNMSGKSTFLRTVGLNMILTQLGGPVFAKSFVFRPVRLLTSFHHIDSLEESTSYFYAELKCLQHIIESLHEPVPALVLLDEVMRGTNSKDKHDGTALLIKKILNYHCLTLIATHDTELGSLADSYPGAVENFCFESGLTDDGLTFDFTMCKGVAQTKNATYLMQKMGII
jgi:hypothetical protein